MTPQSKLQVLICTFGKEGIMRVAKGKHPEILGVEYIVSWQLPDGDEPIPESLSSRPDFKIFKTDTRGLSKNRNNALGLATAPYCLISDDDLNYTEEGLLHAINTFENNPKVDIATFKYTGSDSKYYPNHSFDLKKPPKGYFISSVEIAFRTAKVIDAKVKFNENFGIGAKYPAGEEDIWIFDLLKKGLNGSFFPITIADHKHQTTGIRLEGNLDIIRTKGAVFAHTHPITWPLRMLAHMMRNFNSQSRISSFQYFTSWCKGAIDMIFH